MGRTKGSKNKVSNIRPATCDLTTDQRLQLIANLVIDYIAYDQANGTKLLIRIQKEVICSQ